MDLTMRRDLRCAWAVLAIGALTAGGCGSAAGQPLSSNHGPVSQSASAPIATRTPAAPVPTSVSFRRSRSSGIVGRVIVPAQCGPQPAAGVPCSPDRPAVATIRVRQRSTGRLVALVHTAGRFRIDLAPGAYELAPRLSIFLYAPRVELRVDRRRFEHVVIIFVPRRSPAVAPGAGGCKACPPPPPAAP